MTGLVEKRVKHSAETLLPSKHPVREAKGTDQMLSMHGSLHDQQEGPAVARGIKT